MSSPSKQTKSRTPRGKQNRNSSDHESPLNALHQLAGTLNPTTPAQTSVPPPLSTNRASARHTPRGAYSGANAAPATPHALRALQRRAATYTPGRDRRKSGRMQRETPMDVLRNLGKVLAPTTRPVSSSPQEEPEKPPPQPIDDLDEEPDLPRPRLSLPLTEMIVQGDGSPDIQPPRLSLAIEEDIDQTWRSIEMPRRDRSIQDRTTLSRVSMGSNRFSDRFGDLSRMEDLEEEEAEYTIVQGDDEDDHGQDTGLVFDAGGETEDLRRFNLDFSFPTPDVTTARISGNQLLQEYEDFALDINRDVDTGFPSSDSIVEEGGIELAFQDDFSRPAPPSSSPEPAPQVMVKGNKRQKLSRHGIPVPQLPSGIVKKLATRFARTGGGGKSRISKDTLAAIEQATEWYFEQASDDLSTYAKHAGRKTIDETDVTTLMRRQRHIGKNTTMFALAQKHLPKELLHDIRLPKR
ncbi:H2A superfamily domain-containing protein [Histoplasma ohiense]|nr:H2A superfamily domain-containing protein [Histoplasma ohiense (nom. inval.)]